MKKDIDLTKLCDPFPEEELEWRVMQQGISQKNGQPWAQVVPYIQARAIHQRLDDVAGSENWKNEFRETPRGMLCGLSIRIDGEWVTKWDGAEIGAEASKENDRGHIDTVKTVCTDSFKRCSVLWGIGRFLYSMEFGWAVFAEDGQYTTKLSGQTYRWNPPRLKQGNAPKPVRTRETATKTEERSSGGSGGDDASERQKRIDEVQQWLMDMSIGEGGQLSEDEFNSILWEISRYRPKGDMTAPEKGCRNIDELNRASAKWTAGIHEKAKKKYDAWVAANHPDELQKNLGF